MRTFFALCALLILSMASIHADEPKEAVAPTKATVVQNVPFLRLAQSACSICMNGHGCVEQSRICGQNCDIYRKQGNAGAYSHCEDLCSKQLNSCSKSAEVSCGSACK